jgi:hypothetical protein
VPFFAFLQDDVVEKSFSSSIPIHQHFERFEKLSFVFDTEQAFLSRFGS